MIPFSFEQNKPQLEALLRLLEDDDPDVVDSLAGQIKDMPPDYMQQILDEWQRRNMPGSPPAVRLALRLVALDQFTQIAAQPDTNIDLESGVFLISTWGEPERSITRAKLKIDAYAAHLADTITRHHAREDPEKCARELCRYVFEEMGFAGNEANYLDPANSFLAAVIDARKGIPITLSLLALFIARRIHLKLLPIGAPRRFLLAVHTQNRLTYIDCFGGGLFLKGAQAKKLLGPIPDGVEPFPEVNTREILARILRNLQAAYHEIHDPRRLGELEKMLTALAA